MTWSIRYTPRAERDVASLDPMVRRRVLLAIGHLAHDPRSARGVKALKGSADYRLRVGDWRVVYSLRDDTLIVLVVQIAHRREVYR